MNSERIVINSPQDLLDIRLDKVGRVKTKHKHAEYSFCDFVEPHLEEILTDIGYKVVSIRREYWLEYGRIDFLCRLEDRKYLVIEAKVELTTTNKDLSFSFATGQLLTYRALLSRQYQIKREDIELMLLTDVDSEMALYVINAEGLDISMLVVGENGAKYYGNKKRQ